MPRLASALVLAPLAIAAAYIGGWLFVCVFGVAAIVVLWEWTVLAFGDAEPRVLVPGTVSMLLAAGLAGEGQAAAALGIVALGTLLAGGSLAGWPPRRYPGVNSPAWGAAGVIYAGAALLGPVLMRADPEQGFAAVLYLFAIVWATDVLAYLVGRAVGGPLLWPGLSPKKTWAGAAGGLAGGVAAGTAVAYASVGAAPLVAGVLALILSLLSQGGDLMESAVKRRFGAKDASHLIPGHGGVMDRLDGFLVAALTAVVIGSLHRGIAAPAQGLLLW
ncbi:MAG TPA: phosphatidate cytidylyltransferase [Xanthobacteraceae bacterium]|jgi:phosphatidate cytidylyltransferase|nr:phosphatidate cytidylyltransferase [Xanthobacteraceae bacterium]